MYNILRINNIYCLYIYIFTHKLYQSNDQSFNLEHYIIHQHRCFARVIRKWAWLYTNGVYTRINMGYAHWACYLLEIARKCVILFLSIEINTVVIRIHIFSCILRDFYICYILNTDDAPEYVFVNYY